MTTQQAKDASYLGFHRTSRGSAMQTYGGNRFYIEDPRVEEVDIRDIAHSLSLINRYNGHCLFPYSVAQHSLLVSSIVPREHALQGLLHDAAEAYVGDMTRPMKKIMEQSDYKKIEQKVFSVIAQKFNIPDELHESVKAADNIAVATEKRDVMYLSKGIFTKLPPPLENKIFYMNWRVATSCFLYRFEELGGIID